MKIAILGSRGIPNFHGGFEQFAQYLSEGLVEKGHEVTVYNSSNHPYKEKSFNGVTIVHAKDMEREWGSAGQFAYDFNCIMHVRKQKFHVILLLGYTSSSVWGWLLPSHSVITTNMDGLEWKRTKYSKPVKLFLKYAENLAVKFSDYLIANSVGIQNYLKTKYQKKSVFIPYGADIFYQPEEASLKEFLLLPYSYNMLVARFEPENNIEMILDGAAQASNNVPFLVIGKYQTKFGEYLVERYKNHPNIRFLGSIYDINKLNNLRYYSNLYFHGHSVGGTNPSLLEAMASRALICSHDNTFNSSILLSNAFYFTSVAEVTTYINTVKKSDNVTWVNNNVNRIKNVYSWKKIIDDYEQHFIDICEQRGNLIPAEKVNSTRVYAKFTKEVNELSKTNAE